jgi:hypothetical protein
MAVLLDKGAASTLLFRTPILALTFTTIVFTFYVTSNIIYNLLLHPNRKYPGPLLARTSRIWFVWSSNTGKFHLHLQKAHRTYGPVVRIAPNELSYISAGAWKQIYGPRPGKEEMTKDPIMYQNLISVGSLLTIDRQRHGSIRKLVSSSFSASALREQEVLIQSYADLFMSKLAELCRDGTGVVDMVPWWNVRLSHLLTGMNVC